VVATYRDDVRRDPACDVLLRHCVKLFVRDHDSGVRGRRALVPIDRVGISAVLSL
jgi:hypothetical protein